MVVRGASMQPTLRDGQRLLVVRTRRPPREGEVWVVQHPTQAVRVVKRVATRVGEAWEVRGDNPRASTDSVAWGPLPRAAFVARVLCSYAPPCRVR